jgi:hypothetical protein
LTAIGIGLFGVEVAILVHVPPALVHPLLLAVDVLLYATGLRLATSRLENLQ